MSEVRFLLHAFFLLIMGRADEFVFVCPGMEAVKCARKSQEKKEEEQK